MNGLVWKNLRSAAAMALTAGFAVAIAVPAVAQKASVTYEPASATFDCNGVSGAPDPSCPQGLQGDGLDYRGTAANLQGFFLRTWSSPTYQEFYLNLLNTTRRVYADFSQPANTAPCAATNTCKRTFSYAAIASTDPGGAVIRPVNTSAANVPASGDLPGGLLSIRQGSSGFAGMKLNFADPRAVPRRQAVVWTLRFNPAGFEGSCYLAVSCPITTTAGATCQRWVVESAASCPIAKLVQSPDGSVRGQVDEGLYLMPYRLTVVR